MQCLTCRCGSAEGLDAGRHCLQQWGFRRCEDICWIKTNKEQRKAASVRQDTQAVLQHTKVRFWHTCTRHVPHTSFSAHQAPSRPLHTILRIQTPVLSPTHHSTDTCHLPDFGTFTVKVCMCCSLCCCKTHSRCTCKYPSPVSLPLHLHLHRHHHQ